VVLSSLVWGVSRLRADRNARPVSVLKLLIDSLCKLRPAISFIRLGDQSSHIAKVGFNGAVPLEVLWTQVAWDTLIGNLWAGVANTPAKHWFRNRAGVPDAFTLANYVVFCLDPAAPPIMRAGGLHVMQQLHLFATHQMYSWTLGGARATRQIGYISRRLPQTERMAMSFSIQSCCRNPETSVTGLINSFFCFILSFVSRLPQFNSTLGADSLSLLVSLL